MTIKEKLFQFINKGNKTLAEEYLTLLVIEQKLNNGIVSNATINNAFYGIINDDSEIWENQINDNIDYLIKEFNEKEIEKVLMELIQQEDDLIEIKDN